ncbi:MAG: hypothetical protein IJU40_02950, partial [Desulfovibrionaceae bacterium]|nr:hypothetical protein [Desulfovibrionaceae bacterium]
LSYTTPPQAVNVGRGNLWIDPSVKSQHVLSVPLTFIYPVNRELIEKNISINAPQGSLRFGPTQFVWNESNDSVVLNFPILQLPQKNTSVAVRVNGFQSWVYDKGNRVIQAANKNKYAELVTTITGSENVMDVRDMQIQPIYDDNLGRGFELVVTTSLQTKPQDVLEKLDLLLLPAKNLDKATRNCNWEAMPAISQADIAKSTKIKATLLQPGQEVATEIHLKIPVEAGRGLLCAMKPGLRSTSGLTLNKVRRFVKNVPTLAPEINFLQPGNILPLRQGQKLDLHTVGVERLEWTVKHIRKPFLALLGQKTDFNAEEEVDYDSISEVRTGTINLQADLYKPNYTALDLATLKGDKSDQSSLMYLTLKGFVGAEEKCQVNRLILLSDLGLMLKTAANGTQHVFVRKLSSSEPVKGCKVMILGKNGMPVLNGTTNDDGRCDLPSSYGLTREKKPEAIVALQGQDLAWLSLGDYSSTVDFGDFATQGRHASPQGLLASVFSQRGIYMPGETLHFGAVVTNQDYKAEEKTLALTAVLYDPSNQEIYKTKVTPTKDGLVSLSWKSSENCATGIYRLDIGLAVSSGNLEVLDTSQVKIEEFQPDTLALRLNYAGQKPKGWIRIMPKAQAQIKVNLDNLYGEPARNHRIKAKLLTNPSPLAFKAFKDYTFADLGAKGESQDLDLPEAFTNEQGEALLNLPLDKLGLGTRQGHILVEGFEKTGGRAVGRSMSVLFSPKPYVLGYKPEGEANTLSYLPEGSRANLRLILVDNDLNTKKLSQVEVKVSARRFVTSLVSDSQGLYRYDATPVDTELSSQKITLETQGTLVNLDTKTAGDYLLTITDPQGETLASIPYSVAGNRLAKPGEEPVLVNGTLALKLEKDSFAPGETVHFRISAPYAGTGLVTLERDSVVAHAWFKAAPGESVHEITIPKNFEGRGYINVSFVRGIESPAIYMNPYCYAVAPIDCGLAQHEMGLSLKAPEQVKPG